MLENVFENSELRVKLQYCLDSIVFSNESLHKQLESRFNKLLTVDQEGKIAVNLSLFPDSYYNKFINDKIGEYASALTKKLGETLSFFLAVNNINHHQFMFTIIDRNSTVTLRGLFCYSQTIQDSL